ncbi:MAG: hypothetical protein WCX17_03045 [Parcubacteria group bacterium]|jgi:hypothetical protein
MEEEKNKKENLPPGYFLGYRKEIDNTPKSEAEVQYQSASDKKKYNSSNLVILVTILAVVITSILLLWAVYSVIHVTRLSKLAGMNLTEEAKETASAIVNKKTDDYTPAGYEEWQTYKNDIFELKYPPEWIVEEKAGEVIIRRFNKKTYGYFDSLAASMVYGEFDNQNDLPIKQVLKENHRVLGKNPTEKTLAGKNALQTEGVVLDSGLTLDGIYWALGKKVFYAETTYYDKQAENSKADCQKVLDSLKFLQ